MAWLSGVNWGLAGCATAPPVTTAVNAAGQSVSPVQVRREITGALSLKIGAFTTSEFGVVTFWNRDANLAAEAEQVGFTTNRVLHQFTINVEGEMPVKVIYGRRPTGQTFKLLGVWEKTRLTESLGVVTQNDVVIAKIETLPPVTSFGVEAPLKKGERRKVTLMKTSVGTVDHHQSLFSPPNQSVIRKVFEGIVPTKSDYVCNGELVATRTPEGVWFSPSLPTDARSAIVAEMAVRVLQEERQKAVLTESQIGLSSPTGQQFVRGLP